MVCKEDVLSWFKDLESYKRIDLMYDLLNMCVPFEIRFLGSCIEEIGKHSYHELRGHAIVANDIERLAKDTGLTRGLADETTRHRVLLYISLLSARNCVCANWFYKSVFRTDWLEDYIVKGCFKNDRVLGELLLLFTMALHHPAFSFEQKMYFGRMLGLLMEREREQRLLDKGSMYGCPLPPGFPPRKMSGPLPEIPVKTALPVTPQTDLTTLHHAHPPGLSIPPVPPPPMDLLTASLWNRPGFTGTICGAPEVPPFRQPPPISPLVSQASSPIQSRSTSPHRTLGLRPQPPLLQPPPAMLPPIDTIASATQLQIDPLSNSNLPLFSSEIKLPDEELNHMVDEKLREPPWSPPAMVLPVDAKPLNGLRYAPYNKLPQQPFLAEQMHALSLDGESSLHRSNSSSDSSLNHSPPDTPKSRVNGMPFVEQQPPPPPIFSNCSVPYTTYPIPTRSIFPFSTQPYRAPFNYQPADSSVYTYTVPYVSVMYSSQAGGAGMSYAARNPNCYNCGATGHTGANCQGQTIENITEKKAYTLEYGSPPPSQPPPPPPPPQHASSDGEK